MSRTIAVLTIAAALLGGVGSAGWGPLSHHMGMHIVLMNVVAPLVAMLIADGAQSRMLSSGKALVFATAAELAIFWTAHVPAILAWSTAGVFERAGMQAALFLTALWFWLSVIAQRGLARWRALVALLATGKLFCLLAVLLVFAPRVLYPDITHESPELHVQSLPDQQFAGLLMVAACPLTYVVAAIVISAQMLRDMLRGDRVGDSHEVD